MTTDETTNPGRRPHEPPGAEDARGPWGDRRREGRGRGSAMTYFQRCPYGGGTDPACRNCGRALSSHAQTPDGYECRPLEPAPVHAPDTRTAKIGSAFAAIHLEDQGLKILAHRVCTRWGEIELVARDEACVIFCTVRARRVGAQGPRLPLDAEHARRMRRMAAAWLADSSGPRVPHLRFDAIGITLDTDGCLVALEHLAGAY